MKKLAAVAAIAALLFALPGASSAQTPVPEARSAAPLAPEMAAAVQDLLDAMNYRETMEKTMAQMRLAMPAIIRQSALAAINRNSTLSDAQKQAARAKMEEQLPKAVAAMDAVFNDPQLLDALVTEIMPLYARHFSAAEIHQIADFYRTPVGEKLVVSLPEIMKESIEVSQRVIGPKISALVQTVAAPK